MRMRRVEGLGRPRRNGALLFRQAGPAGAMWQCECTVCARLNVVSCICARTRLYLSRKRTGCEAGRIGLALRGDTGMHLPASGAGDLAVEHPVEQFGPESLDPVEDPV